MPVSQVRSAAQVAQSQGPSSAELKLPKAWVKGKPHRPDIRQWEKFRNDLVGPGSPPKRTATTADVDRVIARAEKNGVSPDEQLALMSVKSTQHMYFEGGADGAAWKKLNAWVVNNHYSPQKRCDDEFARRAPNGKLDVAGAKKLMEWVRGENTDFGALAMKRTVTANDKKLTPEARAMLTAFFARVEVPAGWAPSR